MNQNPSGKQTKVLAIIVLYKCKTEESSALSSIRAAMMRCSTVDLKILIVDNSPEQNTFSDSSKDFVYFGAASNEGLAGSYNRALEIACAENFEWLLTLDQDTTLPCDFMTNMGALALRCQKDQTIAGIVPQLKSGNFILSPNYVHLFRRTPVPLGFTGLNEGEIYALNSAALLRVTAIRELGGFCEDFWLDQLDLWLHHQLYRAGRRVFVAGEIQVEHKLSLVDYGSLSPTRFRNFLEAESAFFDLYKGPLDNLVLTAALFIRYCKHMRPGSDPAIAKEVYERLNRRIFQTRGTRIAQWRSTTRKRAVNPSMDGNSKPQPDSRPRVSVCMATYNGERYIVEQLKSILMQLSPTDEVIIVDDASRDRTAEMIRELGDDRIRVISHEQNLGVLRTFEDAIRRAEGDILFLSDQDDLWVATKVSTVLRTFRLHPDVDIVASDAALIDENGAHLGPSYYAQRGKFRSGVLSNVLRCSYLGCTMAFRSRIRARILPFPTEADVLHDLWIGTSNSLAGGKTLYIDCPLVLYRRHDSNATGNKRLPFAHQIQIRWDLCRSLAESWLRSDRARDK
jgi:GT2 family glycosyltransferase